MAKEKDPAAVKRGRSSKVKGASGEREAAKALESTFPGAEFHRGRQYHGGFGTPDVCSSIEGIHLEIKRTEALSLYTAMQQASEDAAKNNEVPVVLHRRNHKKWLAIVELEHLPELVKLLQPYIKDVK